MDKKQLYTALSRATKRNYIHLNNEKLNFKYTHFDPPFSQSLPITKALPIHPVHPHSPSPSWEGFFVFVLLPSTSRSPRLAIFEDFYTFHFISFQFLFPLWLEDETALLPPGGPGQL